MLTPKLSVVMQVRNGMPYLPQTMTSLLGQTFREFEVIFIDDASTDDTPSYIHSLGDDRIHYMRLEKDDVPFVPDMGTLHRLIYGLNRGLSRASCELVARLDGDDVCHTERFATQFAAFQADPKLVLLGTDFDLINREGQSIGENLYNVTDDVALRWLLFFDCVILQPSAMFSLSAVRSVGNYHMQICAEDYDLWVRLAPVGRIGNVGRKLMQKRQHGQNASQVYSTQGLATTAKLAAGYARDGYGWTGGEDAIIALYSLYHDRPDRPQLPPGELVHSFVELEQAFRAKHGPEIGAEAERAIAYTRELLGWRCYQVARQANKRPAALIGWLRAAGRFDPLRYRFNKIAGRALGLSRSRPLAQRVVPPNEVATG
jgi:hypothetical protein